MASRFQEMISQFPFVTRVLLGVNISVHILMFILTIGPGSFFVNARLVWLNGEYYRIITAAFVHLSIMHIFMNMSSLLQLGVDLERQLGSLHFFFITVWCVLACGALYVGISWLLAWLTNDISYTFTSAAGFSGVLFSFAVLEAYHTTVTSRSVFGLFQVPSRIYPFVLLVILQVIMPGISFIGHLSGIIVGMGLLAGLFEPLLISQDGLAVLEDLTCLRCITRSNTSGWVMVTNKAVCHESLVISGGSVHTGAVVSCCCSVLHAMGHVWNTLCNLISTFLHIIGCPMGYWQVQWNSLCNVISRWKMCIVNLIWRRDYEAVSTTSDEENGGVQLRQQSQQSHGDQMNLHHPPPLPSSSHHPSHLEHTGQPAPQIHHHHVNPVPSTTMPAGSSAIYPLDLADGKSASNNSNNINNNISAAQVSANRTAARQAAAAAAEARLANQYNNKPSK